MKIIQIALIAALATGTAAHAQDNDVLDVDTNVEETTRIVDSFDDNSDNNTDSFNDNSERVFEDSFDDNSRNFSTGVGINSNSTFGDNAIVAETTLSNVVTGADVDFGDVEDTARFNTSLRNNGNAFRNYSGMNALNQNTGVGAAQNASVTIAVSGDGFDAN